jgi:hypothetical protein
MSSSIMLASWKELTMDETVGYVLLGSAAVPASALFALGVITASAGSSGGGTTTTLTT